MNTYNHYDICSEESASFSPMTTDQDASDSSYSQSFEYQVISLHSMARRLSNLQKDQQERKIHTRRHRLTTDPAYY
ncbi:hypothetical protein TVAG_175710 [Trichomonas vaginalis G3]|uniref:Uncharacterized protein n=1 Tax=Trichomonas vaginalis (strain ATCC PRA-98 / G3) TaxID=412133 RepID=A2F5N9_TRIV3|nr:hypothetical protein TVAGG3_1055720 [Trichomonas vaginalis G3]EAX99802.1 hypothetical protein TVAG_175710 [Trichomonas vaginalis G3]KAI5494436.1 hypothetical protein TVAGG3_1055720 [Trichomonas vaginalis G3]|eukprot:XP_001312732.1 hypothetical protein [Trichomonas vaginalis G3]